MKYWYILLTKGGKMFRNNLQKMPKFLKHILPNKKSGENTFLKKAINESKVKIRRVKERIQKKHQ
jgi:hypothetical protein